MTGDFGLTAVRLSFYLLLNRGENVEDAFLETAKQIYQNIQDGSLDLNVAESGVQAKSPAGTGWFMSTIQHYFFVFFLFFSLVPKSFVPFACQVFKIIFLDLFSPFSSVCSSSTADHALLLFAVPLSDKPVPKPGGCC